MGKKHPKVLRHGLPSLPSLQLDQSPYKLTPLKLGSAWLAGAAVREMEALCWCCLPPLHTKPHSVRWRNRLNKEDRASQHVGQQWGADKGKGSTPDALGNWSSRPMTTEDCPLDSDGTTVDIFVDLFNVPEHQATPKSTRTTSQKNGGF